MAKLKLMAQFGGRRSRGAVYGTEHWCLASAGSRRSECNVLGSEHHTECDGYLGTPVVAPRLKSSDHHAARDGYFARLSSLRDYTKSEVGNQIAGDRVRGEAEVGVGGDRLQGTGFRLQELGFGERAAVGARAGVS